MIPTLYIPSSDVLPDSGVWQFRFNIKSESSNRLYTIGQHKSLKHWGCSCMGWKRYRHCKHLKAMGIPGDEKPYEPNILKQ